MGSPSLAVVASPAPVGRLGLAWAAALLVATAMGPAAVAIVVAGVAAVAAGSVLRRPGDRPLPVAVAALLAGVIPLAAAAGRGAALAGVVVVAAAAAAAARAGVLPGTPPAAVAAVVLPGAAAASLVLGAAETGVVAMALASAVCLWDLACYAVGTGSTGGGLGQAAATVSLVVLAVLFAAVADPPLSGLRPWVLFGLLAVAAPLGVAAGRRLAGRRRLPALRRIDSLLVAGPVWVVATQVLLHR
jgi:hypothetical protein